MATSWRFWETRVRRNAKKLAIRAYEGSLVGPELADAIVDLVLRASEQYQSREFEEVAGDIPAEIVQ